jgi:hypothetical protein
VVIAYAGQHKMARLRWRTTARASLRRHEPPVSTLFSTKKSGTAWGWTIVSTIDNDHNGFSVQDNERRHPFIIELPFKAE